MNHTTVAIVIIIAVTALLITASSVSQSDAFAKKKSHRYSHHKSQYSRFFQDANSGIGQRNDQSSVCISGFAIGGSCNNVSANANAGNSVGANVDGNGGSSGDSHGHGHGHGSQRARSNIDQSNHQTAVCISGTAIGGSCNNVAANTNAGNAVGANVGNGGSGHSSQGVNSGINQHNKQTSVCISPGSVSLSCTNTATNINTGSSVGANAFP